MGVVLVTLLVSGLLASAMGAAAWFAFLRRYNAKARVYFLVGIVVFSGIGLLVPVGSFLWSGTVTRGVQVPLDEFRGVSPRLPSSVKHVTYYSDYSGTEALFAIEESDFIAWARTQGWKVAEIDHPAMVHLMRLDIETTITRGIVIDETFHPRGTGVRAVFDRETGICYFECSSY